MTYFFRGLVVLAVTCASFGSVEATAAEPLTVSALRTRIFFVRKGSPEIVNFGTLANDTATDPTAVDSFIVVLLGTGVANLTVTDADQTGDTVRVTGSLQTQVPNTFDLAAMSPDQVQIPLLVTTLGIVRFNVSFDTIVNSTPANYLYRLKF